MLAPCPPAARIAALDRLRGFAVLGATVWLVDSFFGTIPSAADHGGMAALRAFFRSLMELGLASTSLLIFAFALGLGLFLQGERARGAGERPTALLSLRLALLAAFGVAVSAASAIPHELLFLALAGLLAVRIAERAPSPSSLGRWAVGLLAVWGLLRVASAFQTARLQDAFAGDGFAEALLREPGWADSAELLLWPLSGLFLTLAFLLLGLREGRRGSFRPGASIRPLPWILPFGAVFAAMILLLALRASQPDPAPLLGFFALSSAWHYDVAYPLAGVLLALTWIALWGRFDRDAEGRWLLAPLALAGRMAFTNVVLLSLCFSLHLRLGAPSPPRRFEAPETLVLALAVFGLLVLGNHLWLRRFAFGPLEWIVRRAIYPAPRAAVDPRST